MNFPSIVGQCDAVRDSRRTIGHASMSFTADYHVTYTGGGGGSYSVSIGGTGAMDWGRIPLPNGVAHLGDLPGTGNFFMASVGCCCPCRAIYAFDDRALELDLHRAGITAGSTAMPVTLSVDNHGEHSSSERVITLQLWPAGTPPCRRADGPLPALSSPPTARVGLPSELFAPVLDPIPLLPPVAPVITVAGTYRPVEIGQSGVDLDQYFFDFTKPTPCADFQTFSLSVTATWTGVNVSGSAAVTFAFVFGP